ncbi:hypothetical protein CXG81DRAFT_8004, partial [Caulochytrium protostelioides]
LPGVRAWDDDDIKLFDLQHALTQRHGPRSTLYSVLGVAQDATTSQLARAYRRAALKYHPDKKSESSASDDGEAKSTSTDDDEAYALLTSLMGRLRDPLHRARYDAFIRSGFPVYRAASGGYFYQTWRPGIITVLFGCLLFVSAVQALSTW